MERCQGGRPDGKRTHKKARQINRLPNWMQYVLTTKGTNKTRHPVQSQGAASDVRRLNPQTGEVLEVIPARERLKCPNPRNTIS